VVCGGGGITYHQKVYDVRQKTLVVEVQFLCVWLLMALTFNSSSKDFNVRSV